MELRGLSANLTTKEILMKSFRELRVWQQAMELVEMIYRLTRKFPK